MDDTDDPTKPLIDQLAAFRFARQAALEAGDISLAYSKELEAKEAEILATLDEVRGTSDITYKQFREAFEAGAGCEELFELRNGMDPKDPLKADANADLRSVKCFTPKSQRTT